jgi:uncharacterized SAM-binding protein YcdF (DUF218 family)
MLLNQFLRRRTVWLPTLLGGFVFLLVCLTPIAFWLTQGERILSADRVRAPDILVVDGWIMDEPIHAAGLEFGRRSYRYVVAAGGYTGEKWSKLRWSTAEVARRCLRESSVPPEKIILAQSPDADSQRTYWTAIAVKVALDARNISPRTITVFTRGAHALRSRLVYKKVFGKEIEVGTISWIPPGAESVPWWHDSERAVEFIKETCGSLWEWLCDSGR